MEYYSAIRKDEYPSYALTRMELEGIMLSEISEAEKDNYHDLTHMEFKKQKRIIGEEREK